MPSFSVLLNHFELQEGILCKRSSFAGWWKGDVGHQYSAVTRCVLAARVKNPSTDIDRVAAHCQIPALHLHHEHRLHSSHCCHHQLELQGAQNSLNAKLDTGPLSQVPTNHSPHAKVSYLLPTQTVHQGGMLLNLIRKQLAFYFMLIHIALETWYLASSFRMV